MIIWLITTKIRTTGDEFIDWEYDIDWETMKHWKIFSTRVKTASLERKNWMSASLNSSTNGMTGKQLHMTVAASAKFCVHQA
jgi:hypothetical protein